MTFGMRIPSEGANYYRRRWLMAGHTGYSSGAAEFLAGYQAVSKSACIVLTRLSEFHQ
jgi:hypothetical protein